MATEPNARVLLDSINPWGDRLTTMEVTLHRFVLAEFNTHRKKSRNSASSRAIPVEKQLARVVFDPAWPLEWPSEQPGMQGGTPLTGSDLLDAQQLFAEIAQNSTDSIDRYLERHPEKASRLHKSLINRLIEPFMWHTIIASSTEWENFFRQRCSPLAQPEIRVAAEMMRGALLKSTPTLLRVGEWHTPLIQPDEWFELEARKKISAARCARVSYLTHAGVRDPADDLRMYFNLVSADPMHASPLEHVATPLVRTSSYASFGNFDGWQQLRHLVEEGRNHGA